MVSTPSITKMNCHECGRLIEVDSHFCQYCGHELPGEEKKVEIEREIASRTKPAVPIIGGLLVIFSSIFVFITIWIVRDMRGETIVRYVSSYYWPDWFLGILAIFGVVGIIGGLSAIMRLSQTLAIIGGILSTFGLGWIIGVVGLVLIAASGKEFRSAVSDFTEPPEAIDSRALEKSTFGWRP